MILDGNKVEKFFKFLASIKLAIIIIFALGIIAATGTILEARYDANYAQEMVYRSVWMYLTLGLLAVNLLNVMIDRWPWKPHHAGFVFAHVGIILLLLGSLLTRVYGLDGSLPIDIGQKNRYVTLTDTELAVYATFGDGSYKIIYLQPVDFLMKRPDPENLVIPIGSKSIKIKKYLHYAMRDSHVMPSTSPHDGPAIRIQLQNPNINMTQWLMRSSNLPFDQVDLGPARVVLADPKYDYKYDGGNVLVLKPENENKINYQIYTRSKGGLTKKGVAKVTDLIETGWMGIQLRIHKYLPVAAEKTEFIPRDRPSGTTTSAILFDYDGHEQWLGLNMNVKLFSDINMFVVTFRNRLVDIGFDVALKKFEVGRYQGTKRAMSYQSTVDVPGVGERLISMNQPLKHNGITLYQASFQENAKGEATTSILSVNKDPGRPLKYLGCLMIVSGIIIMFYFKHYRIKIFNTD